MKSGWPLFAAVFAFSTGCIRWEQAEASWCNDADLEQRHAVCGLPDTSMEGAVPGTEVFQPFGGKGNQHIAAMAGNASGVFIGGVFDEPTTLGTALVSRGAKDGFLAKLDGNGNFIEAISFGGFGDDQVVDVVSGPNESLYIAVRYTTGTSAPGGLSFSSNGLSDSFLMRLDANLAPTAFTDLGASLDSRVEVTDIAHGFGRVAVSGKLTGFMTVNGIQFGGSQPSAFVVVYDEDLRYLGHAAAFNCVDAIGDSVAIGSSGEVYFAFRARPDDSGSCTLLGEALPFDEKVEIPFGSGNWIQRVPWQDYVARVDVNDGVATMPPGWLLEFPNSVRNPFGEGTAAHKPNGYEAPNHVTFLQEEVAILRHAAVPPPPFPNALPSLAPAARRPAAELEFHSPISGATTRNGYTVGRNAAIGGMGQDMVAKLVPDGDRLWIHGTFLDDNMLLGTLQNGPFVEARHGFVRLWDFEDPSRDWARVFVGRTPNSGGSATGLHVDATGRAWVTGTFSENLSISNTFIDSVDTDGFLFITEPH